MCAFHFEVFKNLGASFDSVHDRHRYVKHNCIVVGGLVCKHQVQSLLSVLYLIDVIKNIAQSCAEDHKQEGAIVGEKTSCQCR